LAFWEERLRKFNVPFERTERFGETYIQFKDYDGLQLEIVARERGQESKWSFGGVPAEKAIKAFGGAILYSMMPEKTMQTLQQVMGLERIGEDQGLVRF
jgi:glyoxalase family protein